VNEQDAQRDLPPAASRIRGRGALLRSLRSLCRRVERFGVHRAAARDEQLWAVRLADRFEAAFTEALDSPGARVSLAAVDRRASLRRKTSPALDLETEGARLV
jgi:hypothetical protein